MTKPALPAPRIRPGRLREIGPVAALVAYAGGRQARSEPLNLFRTLGRHPRLFHGWLHFAGRLMPGGRLPRVDTELVILRVAHLRDCTYEWVQHERIGTSVGLTAHDIEQVCSFLDDAEGTPWTPRQVAILRVVDQLVLDRDVDDAAWQAVAAHLDERECIELVMLATHYDMLAATITALRIQPERAR